MTGANPEGLQVPVAYHEETDSLPFLDVRGIDLGRPFLSESLDELHARAPDGLWRCLPDLPAETVVTLGAEARLPSGLIFHAGRCGSTLLSDLLARTLAVPVVREPDAVTHTLAAVRRGRRDALPLAAAVTRLLADRLAGVAGSPLPAVVKLSAWNVACADPLITELGELPAVFLAREPVASVASAMHRAPSWFEYLWANPAARRIFFPHLSEPEQIGSPVELFAWTWRSTVTAALDLPPDRLPFLTYDGLLDEPIGVLRGLAGLLRMPESGLDTAAIGAVLARDAKDPSRPFIDRADPVPREAVDRIREITSDVWEEARQRAATTPPHRRPG